MLRYRLDRRQSPQVFAQRVFVPPQASAEAAERLAERLREGGITDLLVYHSGELRNGISLGVFADPANAERQAARAARLGVATDRVALHRPEDAHFLLVRRPAAQRGEPGTTVLPAPAGARDIDCPAPASG